MLSGTRASLTPFASLDNTGVPIQERAKAYLHVNCSNCHRPGGIGRGPMDARFDTLFGDMRICNEPPTLGNLGIPGAMHLTPGNNTTSLIWYRMSQRNANFMPPLASTVADATGAQRLEEWIDGLTSCPAPTGPLPCGGPPNRVDNCTFDMGTGDWEYRPNDGGAASLSVAGGELNINVTASGPNNWDPQVVQNLGSVPMGNYVIQFSARAAVPRNIVVNAGQDYAPYASRCPPERTVALTTTMQHFTLTCNTNANESSLKLDFNVGAAGPSTVTIDNVYFGPPR
jgi:hypothetical protein